MAISRLQFVNHDGAASNTDTVTISASTLGSLIVVGINMMDGLTVVSVTDGTNTYVQVPGAYISTTGLAATDIWYSQNSAAGITSVTITVSGTSTSLFRNTVVEYSGVRQTGNPVDTAGNFTSGTNANGPSLTISDPNAVLFTTLQVGALVLTSVSVPWSGSMIDDPKFLYPADLIAPGSTGAFQAVYTPNGQSSNAAGVAFLPPATFNPSDSSMFLVF